MILINTNTVRYLITLALSIFLFGCRQPADLEYVKSTAWIHNTGYRIGQGDYVAFLKGQTLFLLHNDTIITTANRELL